jgi:hypothetical protein
MQTVGVGPPWFSDTLTHSRMVRLRRAAASRPNRQSRWTCADDDEIVHSRRLLVRSG